MNITLGLRALALLAFVAAATAVIIKPEIVGGSASARLTSITLATAIGRA